MIIIFVNSEVYLIARKNFEFFEVQSVAHATLYSNQIDLWSLKQENRTLDDAKAKWPLRSYNMSNIPERGLLILGLIDASNFIETPDAQNNVDSISIVVSSFQTDATSSAIDIPYYQLLPCECLEIALALDHYALMNQKQSPCRDDYPEDLKSLLKQPMEVENYNNPVFVPRLPYDEETCEQLCAVKYWLPKCGCYVSKIAWKYAGSPANVTVCEESGINCTIDWLHTPLDVFKECNCFKKCNQYRFRVVGDDKIRYSVGN